MMGAKSCNKSKCTGNRGDQSSVSSGGSSCNSNISRGKCRRETRSLQTMLETIEKESSSSILDVSDSTASTIGTTSSDYSRSNNRSEDVEQYLHQLADSPGHVSLKDARIALSFVKNKMKPREKKNDNHCNVISALESRPHSNAMAYKKEPKIESKEKMYNIYASNTTKRPVSISMIEEDAAAVKIIPAERDCTRRPLRRRSTLSSSLTSSSGTKVPPPPPMKPPPLQLHAPASPRPSPRPNKVCWSSRLVETVEFKELDDDDVSDLTHLCVDVANMDSVVIHLESSRACHGT